MPVTLRFLNTRTLPALALAGLSLLTIPGCWYTGWHEGGDLGSNDKHVYVSTAWQPKTVWLTDTRSGEMLASWDVPVGQKLAMQFYDEQNKDDAVMPTILRYEIMEASRKGGSLANSMPVPGRDARLLEWRQRPVPEYPPEQPLKKSAGAGPSD